MMLIRKKSGQSAVEFLIITPVMLLLVFGAIQFAFIYQAKNTLGYATFQATRAGALNNANPNVIKTELSSYLAAIYTTEPTPSAVREARGCIRKEFNEGMMQLEILNPPEAAFSDDYVVDVDGDLVIPNDNLMYRSPIRGGSGLNIQDANVLKVRVTYCFRMIVPFVDRTIVSLLTVASAPNSSRHFTSLLPDAVGQENQGENLGNDFRGVCLRQFQRLPITAEATIRMQSPAMMIDEEPLPEQLTICPDHRI